MHNTRRVNTPAFFFLAALSILIGAFVTWWPISDWVWRQPGLGILGWIGLAINGGLVIYPWLSQIGKRIDFFEPIYFMSFLFLLVFFLRPIQILYDYGARVRFMPDDPQLFQQALFFGALGLICFYVGYGSKIGILMGRKLPKFGEHWRHQRVVQVVVVYTLLGMAGYCFAVAQSGGIGVFLNTLRGRRLLAEAGNWSIASMLVLLQIATIILGTYSFKTKRLRAVFIISLALSISSSLLLGGRSAVLVNLLALLVILYYLYGHKPGRLLTRTLLLLMIGIFAVTAIAFIVILKAARQRALGGGDFSAIVSLSEFAVDNFAAAFLDEFGQFDWLAVVLDITPSLIPFQYGNTFLHFFTQFVPRAMWAEKPLPISFTINMLLGGGRAGKPSTILGELYLNFHVPGINVGMVIFGILARAVYAYLQHNWRNPAVILLYAYTFASLQRFFTRAFAPKMFGFVLFMVPAVLALRFIEQRKERAFHRSYGDVQSLPGDMLP